MGTTELSHSFFFVQLCPALSHPSRAYHHEQKTDGWFVLFSESSDKINVKTCVFLINFVNMTLLLTCKFRTVGTSASFASLYSNVEEGSQASWEWIPFYAKIVRHYFFFRNNVRESALAANLQSEPFSVAGFTSCELCTPLTKISQKLLTCLSLKM